MICHELASDLWSHDPHISIQIQIHNWERARFWLIMHSEQNSADWLIDTFNDSIKTQVLWHMEIDASMSESNLIGNCNLETKMTRSF